MKEKFTIIFAPRQTRNGMAAAKRMGNLIGYLKQDHTVINVYRSTQQGEEINDGVAYRSYRSYAGELRQLARCKKINPGEKHIYYHYGYPSVKNIVNLLVIRMMGYQIYLDIVEDYRTIIQYKKGFLRRANIRSSIWLLRHASVFANGYITISLHLYTMMSNLFGKEKTLLLPISIRSDLYPPSTVDRNGKMNFFYGGSFAPKDDFNVMLQAFLNVSKKFPQSIEHFYLAGGCPPEKQQEIMDLAAMQQPGAIEFVGYLDDKKYIAFISKCNVLVMPRNNSEFANTGFPFKLGEYMGSGNCVISAKIPAVVESIGEEAVLYYTPENVESLTAAFSYAITEPACCRDLAINARKIAFEKFDAEKHAHQLTEFISRTQ